VWKTGKQRNKSGHNLNDVILFVCLFDFGVIFGYFLGWGELSHVNYVAHS